MPKSICHLITHYIPPQNILSAHDCATRDCMMLFLKASKRMSWRYYSFIECGCIRSRFPDKNSGKNQLNLNPSCPTKALVNMHFDLFCPFANRTRFRSTSSASNQPSGSSMSSTRIS